MFGASATGPTRRGGDGGRSFRVNSSERFRGEEAEAPPRPSGTRSGAGRVALRAHAHFPGGDRAAARLTTLSPETRPAEKRQPERLRSHTPARAGLPTNTSGQRPTALHLKRGARGT
jgi:hypothetical protein